jgi:membrane protease YdiL (CAAX protease family)
MRLPYNKKPERIDIVFVICVIIFGITIAVQLTYLQSADPFMRNLAEIAIGMGLLSLLGVGFTSFLAMRGVVPVVVFKGEGGLLASEKSFTLLDPEFSRDFSKAFPLALFVQIGINVVFGTFLGFQFDSSFVWELSSFLLVINAGVGEELFFTLFLTGVLLSFRQEKWYVIFICLLNVIIFGIVHTQVYSGNQIALLHILGLRVLYFWVYYKTRRASMPMLLHCFNNFLFVKTILCP